MNPEKQYSPLVITELFAPTKGGTAVWFDQVYRRLGEKNINILTAKTSRDIETDKHHKNSIHRISLARSRWLRPESLAIYIKFLYHGFIISIKQNPTEYHAGRVLPEGFIAYILSRLFTKPCLIYAHGEEITTWITPVKNRVMKFVYCHADAVIANSEFTRKKLIEMGVKNTKIQLINPGVVTDFFRPAPDSKLRKKLLTDNTQGVIFSIGRLTRRKGFDTMVKVIRKLKDEDIHVIYVIAGIGEDKEYLDKLIKSEDINSNVLLAGKVDEEELVDWYNACDFFAMPNREINGDIEGFGMVYIEAAACGKTSISGISGGVTSAVVHEKTGINVDGDDIDSVFIATKNLLLDKDKRERLAKSAHHRAQNQFSWNTIAKRTQEIFTTPS